MSIAIEKDTATPELKFLAGVTPHRLAAEVGPRSTRLVQNNFLKKEQAGNKNGWPSTHFYARAAEATNWQEGFGFVMISVNQIGIRQRLVGGPIVPGPGKKYLTEPAVPDAAGKRAAEFPNLKFAFALDPDNPGTVRPALVEKPGVLKFELGQKKKDGTRSVLHQRVTTGLVPIFWLLAGANQQGDPTVMPSDEQFQQVFDQSVDAVLRHPDLTN